MRRPALHLGLILLLLATACGQQGEQEATGGAAGDPGGGDQATVAQEEGASPAADGQGQGDCSQLEGETITFVVPYDAGGGYDAYARFIGPALQEEIGATVVVDNQPGAGGLRAINNLLTAPADGTTIAIMNAVGSGGAEIADAEGAQFELDELSYVGRVTEDQPVVVTATDGDYDTFQDLLDADGVRLGSNGPGAQDFITATVLNAIFDDLDAEIITGFEGSEEIALTLLRGELDVMSGSLSSRLPDIEGGDEHPVLLMARTPAEELPDTPVLLDMDLDQRQQDLAEAYLSLLELGRAIVAPPDVPEGPLNCLRTAMRDVMEDPEFLAEAEEQGRPIDHLGGEELDQLVAEVTSAPEEFRQVMAEAH